MGIGIEVLAYTYLGFLVLERPAVLLQNLYRYQHCLLLFDMCLGLSLSIPLYNVEYTSVVGRARMRSPMQHCRGGGREGIFLSTSISISVYCRHAAQGGDISEHFDFNFRLLSACRVFFMFCV